MSDLRPEGVKVEIGGQERKLLFTINAVEQIQDKCNLPLYDAMQYVVEAVGGKTDKDTIHNFKTIVMVLLNDEKDGNLTEKEVGAMLHMGNYRKVARTVLEAFGLHIPEPDEDDEEDEDEDPKAETGQ